MRWGAWKGLKDSTTDKPRQASHAEVVIEREPFIQGSKQGKVKAKAVRVEE